MALSCYSNWGEVEHLNSEMTMFAQPQMELSSEFLGFNSDLPFSDPYIDPILESQEFFYSDNYNSLLPYFSSPSDNNSNNLYALLPEVFPEVEYEPYDPYPNPKRQKAFEGCYEYDSSRIVPSSLCNGFVPNPNLLQEVSQEIMAPFPGSFASNPPVFSSGSSADHQMNVKKASNGSSGTLSAQSIAARQRRRKITEKTQELGKLIPGGQKMNTAEMFQAAFKYIKFLQAQVGILETLGTSVQENGESFQNQELNPLLESSVIQEKLYSMEKCLVPKKYVQSIANDNSLQPNTQALKDFKDLIGIGG